MGWFSVISRDYSYLFLLLLLLILLKRDRQIKSEVRLSFFFLTGLSFALYVLGHLGTDMTSLPGMQKLCSLITHIKYALKPMLLCMVLLIAVRDKDRRTKALCTVPLIVFWALLIVSYPFGWIAYHSAPDSVFHEGPLIACTWGILLLYMGMIFYSAVSSSNSHEECRFLLMGEGFIAFNILNERMFRSVPGMENTVIILAILVYYLYFISHAEAEYRAIKEEELSKARIQAMVSQIQPHFIYNSLACIAEICHEGAPRGEKAILTFSSYLRDCFQSLTGDGLIPFSEELRMIEHYIDLEKLQDPEKFSVDYDIRERHFRIPILSVETLVENAVKHGIRKKHGTGRIVLRTDRNDRGIVITIRDDGTGFDTKKTIPDEQHLGIRNARMRLKKQCGADLEIVSRPGEGTQVQIIIPEGESL